MSTALSAPRSRRGADRRSFVLADDTATALVFMADGTGYDADAASGAQQESFHWQVLASGELVLEYDGAVVTVDRVGTSGDVLVVRTDAGGTPSGVSRHAAR